MRRPPNGYIVQILYHFLDDSQTKANLYLQPTEEWKAPSKKDDECSAPKPAGDMVLIHYCEKVKPPWFDSTKEKLWRGQWRWGRHRYDSAPGPDTRTGYRYWSNPGLVGVDLINYQFTPLELRSLGFADEVSIVDVRGIEEAPIEEA